jgi:uncharacterized repeat protein (TIGR01451 family)/fimbrial isopeptide formation D2 family protein
MIYVEWGCCTREQDDSGNVSFYLTPNLALLQTEVLDNCGGVITLRITNSGSKAYNVVLTCDLPAGLIYDTSIGTPSISSTLGTPGLYNIPDVLSPGSLRWDSDNFDAGSRGYDIHEGDTITITFPVSVDDSGPYDCSANLPSGSTTLVLAYQANTSCTPSPGIMYATPSGQEISITAPDLSVELTPETQTAPSGTTASWTATVTNAPGAGRADGTLTYRMTFGDDFNIGTVASPTAAFNPPDVTGNDGTHNYVEWINRSILSGETVTFVVNADVINDLSGENFVTIDVIGECAGGCDFTAGVTDTAYIGCTDFTKEIPDPNGATPEKEYTIGALVPVTITSVFSGNGPHTDMVITDTLPAGLAYFGGQNLTCTGFTDLVAGDFSFSEIGGILTWDATGVTFSTSGTVTITFNAVVEDIPANSDGDQLTNNAASSYYIDTTNFTETASDTIDLVEPYIDITKQDIFATGPYEAGDTIRYSVTIENTGSSTAYGVVVVDDIPDDFTYAGLISTTDPADTVSYNGTTHELTWTLDSPLDPGAGNAQTLIYEITVGAGVKYRRGGLVKSRHHERR